MQQSISRAIYSEKNTWPVMRSVLVVGVVSALLHVALCALQLQQVIVVTRHGDRSPVSLFPRILQNNPELFFDWKFCSPIIEQIQTGGHYSRIIEDRNDLNPKPTKFKTSTTSPSNCFMGQLTTVGQEQHYKLGQQLRSKYGSILPTTFDESVVRVESTDMPRTVQSAQYQIAGLFSNNSSLIPIHIHELDITNFYPNTNNCPKLSKINDQVKHSQRWVDFHNQIAVPLQSQIASILQVSTNVVPGWVSMFDLFTTRAAHQIALPTGFTPQIVQNITLIAEWEWAEQLYAMDREYSILGMQWFMNRVKDFMNMKNYRYVLLSGHDTTIGPLLSFLNIVKQEEFHWPNYAANVIFELYQDGATGNAFVQVLYNGEAKQLPKCSNVMCPWEQFNAITQYFPSMDALLAACYAQQ